MVFGYPPQKVLKIKVLWRNLIINTATSYYGLSKYKLFFENKVFFFGMNYELQVFALNSSDYYANLASVYRNSLFLTFNKSLPANLQNKNLMEAPNFCQV